MSKAKQSVQRRCDLEALAQQSHKTEFGAKDNSGRAQTTGNAETYELADCQLQNAQKPHSRRTDQPVLLSVVGERRETDHYVESFLQWCQDQGVAGQQDWRYIKNLNEEFAEVLGIKAMSAMALSKRLQRYNPKKGYRYLKPGEVGYRSQIEKHGQRPRALWIELPMPRSAIANNSPVPKSSA